MVDPSYYCPGCNRVRCKCPSPAQEEAAADEAYEHGYRDGRRYGPENRPALSGLLSPVNPYREPLPHDYLAGYDDGAAGRPNAVEARYEVGRRIEAQRARAHENEATLNSGDLPF